MIEKMKFRCRRCGRFVGNSNCSTAGSVVDGFRGLLVCDECSLPDRQFVDKNNGRLKIEWETKKCH